MENYHLRIEVFLRENIKHFFSNNYCVISADKHSFDYSDEHAIQNWELNLSSTQSELLSFELYVHQSNQKSFCLH